MFRLLNQMNYPRFFKIVIIQINIYFYCRKLIIKLVYNLRKINSPDIADQLI